MSSAAESHYIGREPTGIELVAVVLVLALGNFLAILDLTITNVLVPHIAGGLATSPSNGTWVITSYGVAEAIMVPLTGWLSQRFGPVRVFVSGIVGFGIFSLLCGMATSLPMLILFRILLGVCGGPLIPLSQTLLVKIVPQRHYVAALAAWSVATVLAPVAGPMIGGLIGDNWSWPWAFYIKVPMAAAIAILAWRVLASHEPPTSKIAVDYGGLALLVVWVAALQIMLGNGQDMDWFNSDFIVGLLIVTILGFVAFVIWELTDKTPIVDLRVFSNRTFAVSMVVAALVFGVQFGSIVLVPLWLQTSMGYTATWAGYNAAFMGVSALLAAPVTSILMKYMDHRGIICLGLFITAAACLMRVFYSDQIDFWLLMWPQLIFGFGIVLVVLPLVDMSTSSLSPEDVASGAGQFNFIRTLSSAISTAAIIALWNNQISTSKAALAGALHDPTALMGAAEAGGMTQERARNVLDLLVQGQGVQQATNNVFLIISLLLLVTAVAVWIVPKPPKKTGGGIPAAH